MKRKIYYILLILSVVFFIPDNLWSQVKKTTNSGIKKTQQSRTSSLQRKKKEQVYYTLPQDPYFSHWSYMINVGASIFDGDVWEANGKKVVPSSDFKVTLGVTIERTFNPIFGLGLEYNYIPYGADPEDPVQYKLKGTSNEVDVYLSVNLLNLFYRSRPQKWNVFANFGLGMAFYQAKMTNKTTGEVILDQNTNELMDLKDGAAAVWPFSLLVEYNINKSFAVGLKGEYRMHNKDNFEGYTTNTRKGNSNDAFSLLSLTFRHKILTEQYHVRNLSYGDPNIKALNLKIAHLEDLINKLPKPDTCCCQNAMDKIAELQDALAKMPKDTVKIEGKDTIIVLKEVEKEKIVEKVVKDTVRIKEIVKDPSIDRDGDGVPDDEDKCPDLKGDPDNFGCPKIKEKSRKVFNRALRGIQFETGRAVIKPVSYPILGEVVTVMKENPEYNLEIIGHTDNVGGEEYNLDLSERRADAVRKFLINNGINSNRLIASGHGMYRPVASNDTEKGRALNRRVEFIVRFDNNQNK